MASITPDMHDASDKLTDRNVVEPGPMRPAVDIYEDDDGITVWADLPGVPKEQLSVHIQNNTLTVEGDISLNLPEDLQPIHAEMTGLRFERVFTLSRDLDAEKAQASFDAGVLRLRIPKLMQERSRRIDVPIS